jgi:hypothetical protein
MIVGLSIPEGSKVQVKNGKILIVFDENETKMDLFKARLDVWATEGNTFGDFSNNKALDNKGLVLSHKNKLTLQNYKR